MALYLWKAQATVRERTGWGKGDPVATSCRITVVVMGLQQGSFETHWRRNVWEVTRAQAARSPVSAPRVWWLVLLLKGTGR